MNCGIKESKQQHNLILTRQLGTPYSFFKRLNLHGTYFDVRTRKEVYVIKQTTTL